MIIKVGEEIDEHLLFLGPIYQFTGREKKNEIEAIQSVYYNNNISSISLETPPLIYKCDGSCKNGIYYYILEKSDTEKHKKFYKNMLKIEKRMDREYRENLHPFFKETDVEKIVFAEGGVDTIRIEYSSRNIQIIDEKKKSIPHQEFPIGCEFRFLIDPKLIYLGNDGYYIQWYARVMKVNRKNYVVPYSLRTAHPKIVDISLRLRNMPQYLILKIIDYTDPHMALVDQNKKLNLIQRIKDSIKDNHLFK